MFNKQQLTKELEKAFPPPLNACKVWNCSRDWKKFWQNKRKNSSALIGMFVFRKQPKDWQHLGLCMLWIAHRFDWNIWWQVVIYKIFGIIYMHKGKSSRLLQDLAHSLCHCRFAELFLWQSGSHPSPEVCTCHEKRFISPWCAVAVGSLCMASHHPALKCERCSS